MWGVHFDGHERISYITANGPSEAGLISFEDESGGVYTPLQRHPGSVPPSRVSVFLPAAPAPTPVPASRQAAALSPAELGSQVLSLPMPDVPVVPHHNGSPNYGAYSPFLCGLQHPHPGVCLGALIPLPEPMIPHNQVLTSPLGSIMGDASPATNSWGNSPVVIPTQYDSSFPVSSSYSSAYSASPGNWSTSPALSHSPQGGFLYVPAQFAPAEPQPPPGPSTQGGLLFQHDQITYPHT